MAADTDTISLVDLLQLAKNALDAGSLGSLVRALCNKLYEGSKSATLSLIRLGELENFLFDPEFIEKLGPEQLKGKKLVRLVFETAQSFSDLVRKLTGMMAAEAVIMLSSSCITELHRGMLHSAYTQQLSAKILLIAKLTSEYNTYATAGEFLQAYLDCADSTLDGDDVVPLVLGVLRDEEVRDLSGDRADLVAALPEHIADEVRDEWVRLGLNQATGDTDDSEADEEGNLRDFVVDDEHVSYSSSSDVGSIDDEEVDKDGYAGRHTAHGGTTSSRSQGQDEDTDSEVEDVKPSVQQAPRRKLRRKASASSSISIEGSTPSRSPLTSTSHTRMGDAPVHAHARAQAHFSHAHGPARAAHSQAQARSQSALLSAFDELAGGEDDVVAHTSKSIASPSSTTARPPPPPIPPRQQTSQGKKRKASAEDEVEAEDEEEDANVRYLTSAKSAPHRPAPMTSTAAVSRVNDGEGSRQQRRAQARASKRARYVDDMANG